MNNLFSQVKNFLIFLFILNIFSACVPKKDSIPAFRSEEISSGWTMQSSEKLGNVTDASISENSFNDKDWYKAVVPGTVLGAMATHGVIKEPYFGINMQSIDPEDYKKPWWFRTSFNLDADDLSKMVSLKFNGINYRADLWVNGKKVIGRDEFAGAYRMYKFNIDEFVVEGENTVALKMWQHADGEYSIGFVDWNPLPRDRNLGIFRQVFVEIDQGVKVTSPFIYSKVNLETLNEADLYFQAEIKNRSNEPVPGVIRVDYELGVVEKEITLPANETFSCRLYPDEFDQLTVKDVNLWWPNGMGDPNLYNMKVEFVANGKLMSATEKKYGIREISSYLNEEGHRTFEINGKFVLIKSGGWVDDLLLQDTKESVEAQMKYIRHMNMNGIRCEGFWGKTEMLYDLCDEYGILVMIGWNCHWEWEEYLLKPTHEKYGGAVTPEDIQLFADMWKDQMLWLRNHPSIYVWMLGSDKLPHPDLERKYIKLFEQYDPSRSYVTSAGGAGTEDNAIVAEVPLISDISGPTGFKMLGPYAYTPPVYWYEDTNLGGAYGFNTETCPGPSIPPVASLRKMLPEESLWPIDTTYWEYHTGRNVFKTLNRYRKALNNRYGKSKSVEEFAFKSQLSNYELMRPMFEAFIAHKPKSTGLVQWMLNSAWPELYWQLYDTYLQPNGSFYGVRKACNPVHAIYRYGFDDIYLGNEDLEDQNGVTVKIKVWDLNSKIIFEDEWKGDIKTNISKEIYKLPELNNLTSVYFLDLRVYDKNNIEVDNSIYWLSTQKDVIDWDAAKKLPWPYYSPSKQFADYTALDKLEKIELEYDYVFEKEGDMGRSTLKVKNPTNTIAFFTFFDLVDSSTDQPILPIYWNDNYITLIPGEVRTYKASFNLEDMKGEKPVLKVKAWNVEPITLN